MGVEAGHGKGAAPLTRQTFDESRLSVARLLHYYPGVGDGDWCGWHNDNSVITGLVPAMFMDDTTGQEMQGFRSDTAGLQIKSRWPGSWQICLRKRLPSTRS